MFIRNVQISGFKSYCLETSFDLRPGLNVIVGRNGSGKSNIFQAIDMALNDTYARLNERERRGLLASDLAVHDKAVLKVLLNDPCHFLPYSNQPLVSREFRETAGSHQARIDDIPLRLQDHPLGSFRAINRLFYIKQGDVGRVVNENDAFRWDLLSEASGYGHFEHWRTACESKLVDYRNLFDQMKLELATLKADLATHQEKASTAKKHKELSSRIATLNFYITKFDALKEKFKMTEAQERSAQIYSSIVRLLKKKEVWEKFLADDTKKLETFTKKITELESIKAIVQADLQANVEHLVTLESELGSREAKAGHRTNVPDYEEIDQLGQRISTLTEDLKAAESNEQSSHANYRKSVARVNVLTDLIRYGSNASRSDQFDKLRKEDLREKQKELVSVIKQRKKHQGFLQNSQAELQALQQELKVNLDSLEGKRKRGKEIKTNFQQVQTSLSEHRAKRSPTWAAKANKYDELQILEEALVEIETRLNFSAGRNHRLVAKIVEDFKRSENSEDLSAVSGYYGTVMENLAVVPVEIRTAVEVSAGRKLFYHVVNNGRTARQIMREYNHRKYPGEVFFLVESNINVRPPINVANLRIPNAEPLLPKIGYNPRATNSIQHTFGRFVLCQDVDGIKVDPKMKMNFVSLDGDLKKSNGPMTGGYRDPGKSVLEAQERKLEYTRKRSLLVEELSTISQEEKEWLKEDGKIKSEIDKVELALMKISDEIRTLKSTREGLTDGVRLAESQLNSLAAKVTTATRKEVELNAEIMRLSTPYSETISNPTEGLKQEEKTSSIAKTEYDDFSRRRTGLENELTKLKILRRQSVLAQSRTSSVSRDGESESSTPHETLQTLRDALRREEIVRTSLLNRENELIDETRKATVTHRQLTLKIEKILDAVCGLEKVLTTRKSASKAMYDRLTRIRSELEVKLKELDLDEAEFSEGSALGVFPEYKDLTRSQLIAEMKGVSNEMKKLKVPGEPGGIDDLVEIRGRKEKAIRILKDAERGCNWAENFLRDFEEFGHLIATFILKEIQQTFTEIYTEILAESGDTRGEQTVAQLILCSGPHEFGTDSSLPPNLDGDWGAVKFNGARLVVTNPAGITQDITCLSGGQRTVLALSLILSIQRNCRTRFFLFDEIDQALDERYRRGVVKVMKRFVSDYKAQFVCTTFSRRFVEEADHILLVSDARNARSSSVEEISLERALALPFLNDTGCRPPQNGFETTMDTTTTTSLSSQEPGPSSSLSTICETPMEIDP